jgi:hypothetical protein
MENEFEVRGWKFDVGCSILEVGNLKFEVRLKNKSH